MAADSSDAAEVEKLYEFGERLNESKDKSQNVSDYEGIIMAVKGRSVKAKQLAAQLIPRFFKFFPSLASDAMTAQFDLIEEDELGIRVQAIRGLPLLCKDNSEYVSKIVDVLGQLLTCEENVERDAVHKALMSLLRQDIKASLTALFKHIEIGIENIREKVICFIKDKVFPLKAELLKPQAEMERYVTDLVTTSLKEIGIQISIPKAARSVLNGLRKKGFEVYLVGGCVRDVIMNRTPKDFDILTTAELREVKQTFSHCEIVGKRFPICHVHINGSIIEVSSFSTHGRNSMNDLSRSITRPPNCDDHDYFRWRNCLRRDFTINGLMLNPFSNRVHDYFGGIKDLKKAKVRTVIPPQISFTEDCARILRAIRIAARLDFNFSRETAHSIVDLASSVVRLDKGRLLMEVNYMFAYGSAQASLRMLWRFGLLELLLPIQAAYFASQGFRRRDKRTNMLLALFSNLDMYFAPDKPCHHSLWIGLLAFHGALAREPRDPLAVSTFIFALSNGGDLAEAIKIARAKTPPHDVSFPELLQPHEWHADRELIHEVQDLASSVHAALSSMTDEYIISKAMSHYPQAPISNLVFIPLQKHI